MLLAFISELLSVPQDVHTNFDWLTLDFLSTVPQSKQVWDVYLGSTLIKVFPLHSDLYLNCLKKSLHEASEICLDKYPNRTIFLTFKSSTAMKPNSSTIDFDCL